ncbi:hypothetical protein [Blastopirellula marina]|uniref:hypothetical protein n=1 Tax=Blastopirellula marina TaxID=124 RepID=UPI0011B0599C|nr:hypothetical protein [Blastopirellula marina]
MRRCLPVRAKFVEIAGATASPDAPTNAVNPYPHEPYHTPKTFNRVYDDRVASLCETERLFPQMCEFAHFVSSVALKTPRK